jgi:DNA-binding transcriptional regulator YiaG
MPNIASLLKTEITRLANKAVRTHLSPLQSAQRNQRRQIAKLRQEVSALEKQLAQLRRGVGKATTTASTEEEGPSMRFVAKGFKTLRARLDLSAAEMAKLLGVSAQSVYKWELGKAKPRAAQLGAIAALRGIGKREARARLESA